MVHSDLTVQERELRLDAVFTVLLLGQCIRNVNHMF